MKNIIDLSNKLREAKTDKERIRLLLYTIDSNLAQTIDFATLGLVAYASGYLGSLLVQHGLNDWEVIKETEQ